MEGGGMGDILHYIYFYFKKCIFNPFPLIKTKGIFAGETIRTSFQTCTPGQPGQIHSISRTSLL